MKIIELAERFKAVASSGGVYIGTCPACNGKITLTFERGKTSISCRSKCAIKDILRAAELPYGAIFEEPPTVALNWDELMTREFIPVEPMLGDLFSTGSINNIFGTRGVGKTHFGVSLGQAVAGGGQFLKWKAPVPRPVLYVDGELRGEDLQRIFRDCYNALQKDNENFAIAPDFLRVIPSELTRRRINLATEEGQSIVEEFIADRQLVIVDNISCLVRGGPSNDGESWIAADDWALGLRARGISVTFLDHAGKDPSRGTRGTSEKEDHLDTIVQLSLPPGIQVPNLSADVKFTKTRSMFDSEPFHIELITNSDGSEWDYRAIEDRSTGDKLEAASELFSANKTVREVARELGIANGTAGRYRKKWQSTQPSGPDLN